MSHFCVLVIGDNPELQLEPYDENLEMDMHLVQTKEEVVQRERKFIESYKNGTYAEFLKDPDAYKESHMSSESHIKYLEEDFPKLLSMNDDEIYEEAVKDYRKEIENGAEWVKIDDEGNIWKIYNEDARWDWYVIGGRWRGKLKLKQPIEDAPLYTGWQFDKDNDKEYERLKKEGYCDQAYVEELANLDEIGCFAVVKDGEWYERGTMGWWCCVSDEKEESDWDAEVKLLLKDLPEGTLITVVDCHI